LKGLFLRLLRWVSFPVNLLPLLLLQTVSNLDPTLLKNDNTFHPEPHNLSNSITDLPTSSFRSLKRARM